MTHLYDESAWPVEIPTYPHRAWFALLAGFWEEEQVPAVDPALGLEGGFTCEAAWHNWLGYLNRHRDAWPGETGAAQAGSNLEVIQLEEFMGGLRWVRTFPDRVSEHGGGYLILEPERFVVGTQVIIIQPKGAS